jgi:streptogramin lyase
VAHGGRNLIRLLDKNTGAPIREISVSLAPKTLNQVAMSPSGDLWVLSGNRVLRYTDLAGEPRIKGSISGLTNPLGLATAERGDEGVWIAEGGSRQQVRKFDSEGKWMGAIGTEGGYDKDPRVMPGKLCFRAAEGKEQTAIGVAADGSIWVVDQCNNRMLRFPAAASSAAPVAWVTELALILICFVGRLRFV